MSSRFVLAIDVGTSSIKAAAVTAAGEVLDSTQVAQTVERPRPGWAEQSPDTWWEGTRRATAELWRRGAVEAGRAEGLVFATQMLGTLPVDAEGRALHPCLIWLDTRSREQARRLTRGFPRVAGYGLLRLLRWLSITNGAPNLAGRDPPSKIAWLRESLPEVWGRAHKLLGVKDWLVHRCTGRFLTTWDCASPTWLMCTRRGRWGWSAPLLALVGARGDLMPELVGSSAIAGALAPDAAGELGLSAGLPVVAGAGDLTAAAGGSGAVATGEAHLDLGTSGWAAAHVDDRCVDPWSATATVCAALEGKYLLVAEQETAGAALEWARAALLGGEGGWEELDRLSAAAPPGADGVFFFPWLAGERAPVDDAFTRAGWVNLGLEHDRRHLVRAVHEGVAHNLAWALAALERLSGRSPERLRLVGGGARSDAWCQVLADVLDRRLERVAAPHLCGVRGAAQVAALGLGLPRASGEVRVERTFEPSPGLRALYAARQAEFLRFYRRNRSWFRALNRGR